MLGFLVKDLKAYYNVQRIQKTLNKTLKYEDDFIKYINQEKLQIVLKNRSFRSVTDNN